MPYNSIRIDLMSGDGEVTTRWSHENEKNVHSLTGEKVNKLIRKAFVDICGAARQVDLMGRWFKRGEQKFNWTLSDFTGNGPKSFRPEYQNFLYNFHTADYALFRSFLRSVHPAIACGCLIIHFC